MRSFVGLLRKDLKAYFDQPTGYILLVIFVGIVSYLYFRMALVNEEASMRPMFTTLPWVLAIFVPAATMRLIAEEQRDGTLEILFTQPIRASAVLLAKFLAGFIFVSIAVLLTAVIPLALMTAGNVDSGAVIGQYVGTLLLTAAFVATGLFASALTQNQIVSFMVALTLAIGLSLMGMPLVTVALPQAAAVIVQDLSPLTHYRVAIRGVIDLRDVIYFLAVVSAFMSGTYLLLRGKSISHRSNLYLQLRLGVAALVVLSLLVGWFGSSIQGRWDLTENKLFTLSPATKKLLSELDDIVTIRYFASKEPPAEVALVARDLNDFLDDVEQASNGNVKVVRKHPDQDVAIADEADRNFVPPVQLNIQSEGEFKVQLAWLGFGMTYANRREAVPYVNSVNGLEPIVAASIHRMSKKDRKTVAVLTEHGEKNINGELATLGRIAGGNHNVIEITDDEGLIELEPIDILIVPGPTEIIRQDVYNAMHNFLARGGKALIMLDSVIADPRTLSGDLNGASMADFLDDYGVELQENVVFDLRSSESVPFASQFGTVALRYPWWARVFTTEKRISGGVESVVMPWASSLEVTAEGDPSLDAEIQVLIRTSPFGVEDNAFLDLGPEARVFETVTPEQQDEHIMAVAITGNRCPTFEPECEKNPDEPFRMIVVGDSEWATENLVRQYPDQVSLAANYIDWLADEDELAAVRAKGATLRRLVFDSDTHRNLVQYGSIVGVPVLLIALGLLRYAMRRRGQRRVYGSE